jgi:YjbE family integral membrane protein
VEFFTQFAQPAFWVAALQIIWINILLSGDNAVVIALACRGLHGSQRRWGMILGAGAAILLRVVFTVVIAQLMGLPFLKLVGGVALLWIAIKLIVPDEAHGEDSVKAGESLWRAVRIVAIADIVMSLDNVIAIAAAAKGNMGLIVFGLVISIPMIIAGAAILMAVLDRFPILVWAGAALLGWIAGEIMIEDPATIRVLGEDLVHRYVYFAAAAGALFVVALGWLMLRARRPAAEVADV